MSGWLLRLFPGRWRRRYGVEYQALLEDEGIGFRVFVNVMIHAISVQAKEGHRAIKVLVALAVTIGAEWYAARHGYAVNVLWLPRSSMSLLILCTVVVSLGYVIATGMGPLAAAVMRRTGGGR